MPEIVIKEIVYKEYGKCLELSNGVVDLVITLDVGPRVIRFGFIGKDNEFCEGVKQETPVDGGVWRLMGGHRLWHSPESMPRTYSPDNSPVSWEKTDNGVRICQDVEPWVQIAKRIEISLAACCNKVSVKHTLINKNAWPVKLSAWALTVMAPGGREIVPQPRRDTGLLGNRVLALWPYTNMNDSRIFWGEKYIILDQDPAAKCCLPPNLTWCFSPSMA